MLAGQHFRPVCPPDPEHFGSLKEVVYHKYSVYSRDHTLHAHPHSKQHKPVQENIIHNQSKNN